jgi:hypothetical protein
MQVAKAVQSFKPASAKWIDKGFPQWSRFACQERYGAFSVSILQREKTAAYIHAQQEHISGAIDRAFSPRRFHLSLDRPMAWAGLGKNQRVGRAAMKAGSGFPQA